MTLIMLITWKFVSCLLILLIQYWRTFSANSGPNSSKCKMLKCSVTSFENPVRNFDFSAVCDSGSAIFRINCFIFRHRYQMNSSSQKEPRIELHKNQETDLMQVSSASSHTSHIYRLHPLGHEIYDSSLNHTIHDWSWIKL